MTGFAALLRAGLGSEYAVSDEQVQALFGHWQMLERWNARLNLTTIRDVAAAVRRHYVESIVLARRLPPGGLRIADAGSGAGFPGIPLAIVRPECEVTLIEAVGRKSVFLREASVGLANVRVAAARLEDFGGEVDWVVSRAVKPAVIGKWARARGAGWAMLLTRGDAEALGAAEIHPIPGEKWSVVAIFEPGH